MNYELIATTTFGIEAVTAKELKELGYEDLKLENGKVHFEGDELDIAITNTWLRTADRVLIKMAEFEAKSFEELFQGTAKVDWGKIIPLDGKMHVTGKSVKSTLHSVPDCQSIVKKAVVKSMQERYKRDWFSEDGPVYKIEVSILKDVVTLTIDTTGPGLHKRGYREHAGAAPLKETLAATLVLLSRWNKEDMMVDPFCGSGTILIEAAQIAKNIAPGAKRTFVSEEWPTMNKNLWSQVREGAERGIKKDCDVKLVGYDINGRVLSTALQNANLAGVSDIVDFHRRDFREFSSSKKDGIIITNPPYGERIGEKEDIEELYRLLGKLKEKLYNWDFNVLTSYDTFQKLFGRKATKNRKLYNGRLQCYYYQYLDKK
ncbi:THUMP domain-containing class I SAM-dependent RNA methyltransferase [Clostridium fallax]|uniref:Putative N6-adenine-specific DNA methylase n=1 Tax=Clostridium fallax TaxID=1533 RepID=A0A1M4YI15_9CLOT|nr:class I SAM-dependent RNA methyltransferase [Clostridium fallax]SHF05445.1 putative N6-adenine-specific DNA methylase [Clostridium fallax]SQB06318.1 RNA methylase [Clostridium fallax]